jgi:hypothetical protein
MASAMRAAPGHRADDIRSAVFGTLDPQFSEKTPELFEERKSQLSNTISKTKFEHRSRQLNNNGEKALRF